MGDKMKFKIFNQVINIAVISFMAVQIIFGLIWMIQNVNSVPGFGDTPEYIKLSESMKVDEYRTIFYPFLLKCSIALEHRLGIAYHYFMYAGQTVLCYVCILYMVHFLFKHILKESKLFKEVYVSLYLLTIPMITFHNLTILPDSLALSALLVVITQLVKFITESVNIKDSVIFFLAIMLELMIRADRIYSLSIVALIYCVVGLIKSKDWKKYLTVILLTFFAVVLNLGINSVTQKKGYYGRVETNLPFVLLDRVVFPHMTENYEYFSDEIKANVTIEDAQLFDSHNNHVMYSFAPMLESKVGKEKASEMYVEMAKVVWKNDKSKVISEIFYKFRLMFFMPIYGDLCMKGKVWTNFGWLYYNFSQVNEKLTRNYIKFYDIGFAYIVLGLSVLLTILGIAFKNSRQQILHWLKALALYFIILFVIVLWFAVGDGDGANHRYVLLGYIIFTILPVGVFSEFNRLINDKNGGNAE